MTIPNGFDINEYDFSRLEAMRKKILFLFRMRSDAAILLIFLPLIYLWGVSRQEGREVSLYDWAVAILSGLAIGSIFFAYMTSKAVKLSRSYRDIFKKELVGPNLCNAVKGLKYLPEGGISSETVFQGGVVKLMNIYVHKDYVSAEYKGVALEYEDLIIRNQSKKNRGRGRAVVNTYFEGSYLILDLKRDQDLILQIRSKEISEENSRFVLMDKLLKLTQEEDCFWDDYVIYSNNKDRGLQFIRGNFTLAYKAMVKAMPGQIGLNFTKGKLHIAIYNKSRISFEPPVDRELDKSVGDSIVKELHHILDLVDGIEQR